MNARLPELILEASSPVPPGNTGATLASLYLFYGGWGRAAVFADALLEALPCQSGGEILGPLSRLGQELALSVVVECTGLRHTSDKPKLAARMSAQMRRIGVVLERRRAVGHLEMLTAYRTRFEIMNRAFTATRDLAVPRLPPALAGCLVELIAVASACDLRQLELLLARLRQFDQQKRLRLVSSLQDTVAEALENLWAPAIGAQEMRTRQDAVQDELSTADPEEIPAILARSQPASTIISSDSPASFFAPLAKNPYVGAAIHELPAVVGGILT